MTTTDFDELSGHLRQQPTAPTVGRHMGPGYALPNTVALLNAVRLTAAEEMRELGLQDRPNPIAAIIPSGINNPMFVKIRQALERADAGTAFDTAVDSTFAPGVRVRVDNHRNADATAIDDIPIGTTGTIQDRAQFEEAIEYQPAWNVEWDEGWGNYWVPEDNMVIFND